MGRPVMQWQILAKNPDGAAARYAALFGWSVDADNPLGYRRFDSGSDRGIPGGVWPSPPEGDSRVQLFVEVDDLAATIERATELGFFVVVPPQILPEGDELAIIADEEGISFGLHRPAR